MLVELVRAGRALHTSYGVSKTSLTTLSCFDLFFSPSSDRERLIEEEFAGDNQSFALSCFEGTKW